MQQMEASNSKCASKYKEIITKAVCGNATKFFTLTQLIEPPKGQCPTKILGTTVTKLQLGNVTNTGKAMTGQDTGVKINGSLEIHVWYAHKKGNSTDAARQHVQFEEFIPIPELDEGTIRILEARVEAIKSPECLESTVTKDHNIKVKVELGVFVELIGETRILVCTCQPDGEDDDS